MPRPFLLLPLLPLLSLLFVHTTPLTLEGSPTSYIKYSPWQHSPTKNNSLLLDFNTNQPDGLLLYTDDSGDVDFFELKLVEGSCRLRYNLGEHGTQLLQVGRHLNDGLWHRAEIRIHGNGVSLTVDGFVTKEKLLPSPKSLTQWDNAKAGGVFVGGLPSEYNDKLPDLSLPSVVFEPRFRGGVRNLVYSSGSGVRGQTEVEWKGLISTTSHSHTHSSHPHPHPLDPCERHDPCLHGGFCISTDNGPLCDCKHIDWEGVHCEEEKPPITFSFSGSEYVGYDFSESGGEPIVSTLDEISFSFRTVAKGSTYGDALLFYSGDSLDYLAVTLRDGRISLSVNLGSGPLDAKIHPDSVRFDDGGWHGVRIHRKVQEMSKTTSLCHITASVDGSHFDRWTLAGSFTLLSSNRVSIGGYDMIRPLPGLKGVSNFIGCMRKVEYRADTLWLNLLELGRRGGGLVSVGGSVGGGGQGVWSCPGEVEGESENDESENFGGVSTGSGEGVVKHLTSTSTVTFTTPESFLVVPMTTNASFKSISFKIRTTEENGVLVWSRGARGAFLALELVSGTVYAHVATSTTTTTTTGSGLHLRIPTYTPAPPTTTTITDGNWHAITLARSPHSSPFSFSISIDDDSTDFNTKSPTLELGDFYIGGVPMATHQEQVWSLNTRQGFVGCMRGLSLGERGVDLGGLSVVGVGDGGSVRGGCHVGSAGYCASNPCLNSGRCRDGWGRFICECGGGFVGVVCQRESTPLSLSTHPLLLPLPLPLTLPMEATSLTLRFTTSRPSGTILLLSGGEDFIELSLHSTRLSLRVRMSDREKTMTTGRELNNNAQHYVQFSRRGNLLILKLDDIPHIQLELLTRNWGMQFNKLSIGSHGNPFSGRVTHLRINNVNFLNEWVRQAPSDGVELVGWVGLPQVRIYAGGEVFFWIKSGGASGGGLVFYNGGVGSDFILLEMTSGGKLVFGWDVGRGRGELQSAGAVADGRWHFVEVGVDFLGNATKKGSGSVRLGVDGAWSRKELDGGEVLELNGVLYLGGLPAPLASTLHLPTTPFQGCVGGLEFGGEYLNPLTDALVNPGGVRGGCGQVNHAADFCTSSTCQHGGVCSEGRILCDCDETGMTGVDCGLESTTYLFLPPSSLTYTPHGNIIPLSLAFVMATHSPDALIVKIHSPSSTDFLELLLSNGKLKLVLKLDAGKEVGLSLDAKMADRQPHRVKVRVDKGEVRLGVDGEEVRRVVKGRSLEHPIVLLGGGRNKRGQFKGLLSGLVLNSARLLDMAHDRSPLIRLHGNSVHPVASLASGLSSLRLHSNNNNLHKFSLAEEEGLMQKTTASHTPSHPSEDNLIISSGEGKCPNYHSDDEDCDSPGGSGGATSDDLITPVYVPAHKPSTTTRKTTTTSSKLCDDDDEDCFHGSGDTSTSTSSTTSQHVVTMVTPPKSTSTATTTTTTSATSKTTPTTTPTTTTLRSSTPFIPPHPPSLTPIPHLPGRDFDFDTSHLTTTPPPPPPTTTTDVSVYIAEADSHQTMIVIIILAVLMIIIVCILIIFFMCKRREDPIYKVQGGEKFGGELQQQQQQQQQLMLQRQQQGQQQQLKGGLKGGGGGGGGGVKEWYV